MALFLLLRFDNSHLVLYLLSNDLSVFWVKVPMCYHLPLVVYFLFFCFSHTIPYFKSSLSPSQKSICSIFVFLDVYYTFIHLKNLYG